MCWKRITAIDSLLSPLRGTPVAYLNAHLACFLTYVNTHRPFVSLAPRFYLQKHYAKSGTLGFFERTPEACTNLSWKVRFLSGMERGIEVLAKPIFVRGIRPFNGSGTAVPLRRLAKPMRLPPKLPIASLIPYGVKCCRILSFPKALFYSLATLRIK